MMVSLTADGVKASRASKKEGEEKRRQINRQNGMLSREVIEMSIDVTSDGGGLPSSPKLLVTLPPVVFVDDEAPLTSRGQA